MGEHDKGTVTPYVLDNSHNPELKQMAREFILILTNSAVPDEPTDASP